MMMIQLLTTSSLLSNLQCHVRSSVQGSIQQRTSMCGNFTYFDAKWIQKAHILHIWRQLEKYMGISL